MVRKHTPTVSSGNFAARPPNSIVATISLQYIHARNFFVPSKGFLYHELNSLFVVFVYQMHIPHKCAFGSPPNYVAQMDISSDIHMPLCGLFERYDVDCAGHIIDK